MTTLGFHYLPDDLHYRLTDWQAWQPELRALGAKWLTLIGSTERAIPEAFIKSVQEAGIEPIVHIPVKPIQPIASGTLEPLLATYAKWGVRFVSVFSEPNARAMWEPTAWGKTALVERFLEIALPVWKAQAESGLAPMFPALKAGGDYWDLGFLEAALNGLTQRNQTALLQQMVFALNLWTFNRPLDWGAGGAEKWPQARPYLTPPGAQDERGFHLFDWLTPIIKKYCGDKRPLICLAGGPRLGDHTDPNLPALDEARHASCTTTIQQMLSEKQLPNHLLNFNFWLLAAPRESVYAAEAWYRPDGSTLPAVDILKRAQPPSAKSKPTTQNTNPRSNAHAPKFLRHYILMPTFEWGISEWHWKAAFNLMKAQRPVCGFSPDEARQAQTVTIIGNEQGISPAIEQQLREAGCDVRRVLLNG